MEGRRTFEKFSLFGGPLHRMGERLGFVRGGRSAIALGLALGLLSWSILCGLALIERRRIQVFFTPRDRRACSPTVSHSAVVPLQILIGYSVEGVCQPDCPFGRRAHEWAAGAGNRNHADQSVARLLVSGSNVPPCNCAADIVRRTFAPVWKNNRVRPGPRHRRVSLGWFVVLDHLSATRTLPWFSLALAGCALVVFPLARGKIGTSPCADSSRWRRRAWIS